MKAQPRTFQHLDHDPVLQKTLNTFAVMFNRQILLYDSETSNLILHIFPKNSDPSNPIRLAYRQMGLPVYNADFTLAGNTADGHYAALLPIQGNGQQSVPARL